MWNKINSNPIERIVECIILCSFMLYLFLLIRNVNYYKRNLLKTRANDYVKKENLWLRMREEISDVSGWISLVNALTLLSPPYFWFLRSVLYYDLRPILEQSHSRSYIFVTAIISRNTFKLTLTIYFSYEKRNDSGMFHRIGNQFNFFFLFCSSYLFFNEEFIIYVIEVNY